MFTFSLITLIAAIATFAQALIICSLPLVFVGIMFFMGAAILMGESQ